MNNIILEKIALLFLRGIALMSVFLLLRGHNSPGGGFIGAIVLAIGFIFYGIIFGSRSEEHTSELQSRPHLVCRLLLEKKKIQILPYPFIHTFIEVSRPCSTPVILQIFNSCSYHKLTNLLSPLSSFLQSIISYLSYVFF